MPKPSADATDQAHIEMLRAIIEGLEIQEMLAHMAQPLRDLGAVLEQHEESGVVILRQLARDLRGGLWPEEVAQQHLRALYWERCQKEELNLYRRIIEERAASCTRSGYPNLAEQAQRILQQWPCFDLAEIDTRIEAARACFHTHFGEPPPLPIRHVDLYLRGPVPFKTFLIATKEPHPDAGEESAETPSA